MIEKETRLQLAKDENDYNVWLNKYKIFLYNFYQIKLNLLNKF